MKRLILIALLLISVPLYAVTIGGNFKKKTFTVTFVGDSIAAGYGSVTPSLLYLLQQHYPSTEYTYTNYAVAGAKASDVLGQLTTAFGTDFPDYVVVLVGTNDINFDNDTFTEEQSYFDAIRTACNTAGSTLVICEVLPRTTWSTTDYSTTITLWNSQLATWCTTYNVKLALINSGFNTDLLSDGRHPTAAGNQLIASLMWQNGVRFGRYDSIFTQNFNSTSVLVTYNNTYITYGGSYVTSN